jgi:hypothetical protein
MAERIDEKERITADSAATAKRKGGVGSAALLVSHSGSAAVEHQ